MELSGNLLWGGDDPGDAHGPLAAGADGDIDAEDASEEGHPREPTRGGGTKQSLEPGGGGRKLEGPVGDEEGELLGLGLRVRARDDAGAQGVMPREDTLGHRDVGMQAPQRMDEVFIGEPRDGAEARLALVRGLEAAIGDERMQMDEQPQVVAEALYDDEDARVQGSAARQAVLALGQPANRLHDPRREPLTYAAEQGTVVPQTRWKR